MSTTISRFIRDIDLDSRGASLPKNTTTSREWVKASERIPEKSGQYPCRDLTRHGNKYFISNFTLRTSGNGNSPARNKSILLYRNPNVEWLQEKEVPVTTDAFKKFPIIRGYYNNNMNTEFDKNEDLRNAYSEGLKDASQYIPSKEVESATISKTETVQSEEVVKEESEWICLKDADCECSNQDKDAFISPDIHASCQYHKRKISTPQTDDKLIELIQWVKSESADLNSSINNADKSAELYLECCVIEKITSLLNKPKKVSHNEKKVMKAFHEIAEIPEVKAISITLTATDLYDNVVEAVKQFINTRE